MGNIQKASGARAAQKTKEVKKSGFFGRFSVSRGKSPKAKATESKGWFSGLRKWWRGLFKRKVEKAEVPKESARKPLMEGRFDKTESQLTEEARKKEGRKTPGEMQAAKVRARKKKTRAQHLAKIKAHQSKYIKPKGAGE